MFGVVGDGVGIPAVNRYEVVLFDTESGGVTTQYIARFDGQALASSSLLASKVLAWTTGALAVATPKGPLH